VSYTWREERHRLLSPSPKGTERQQERDTDTDRERQEAARWVCIGEAASKALPHHVVVARVDGDVNGRCNAVKVTKADLRRHAFHWVDGSRIILQVPDSASHERAQGKTTKLKLSVWRGGHGGEVPRCTLLRAFSMHMRAPHVHVGSRTTRGVVAKTCVRPIKQTP